MGQTLKDKFINDILNMEHPNVVVVAVRLPTGAIETITNTQMLKEKLDYYNNAYDDDFKLKTNGIIQIVGYMIA